MLKVKVLGTAAKDGRTLRWVLAIGWFAVAEMALTACGPRQVHSAGVVSLEYAGISGPDVIFQLKNESSKKISFRGTSSILEGADPWDTQIVCHDANGTTGYDHPIALVDRKPASINVSPGDQMRLRIGNEIAAGAKGSHCHLRLKLEDSTVVESSEFTL
jgi:hypothetical protein